MRARITTNRWNKDPAGEGGQGYAGNSELIYSRVAAAGGNAVRRDPNEPRQRPNGYMPSDEKIRQTQVSIGKLESLLMFERRLDPKSPKIAKLEKDLKVKNALLVEYGRERHDPNYMRQKIRV